MLHRAAKLTAATGIALVMLLGFTPGSAFAAEVKFWDGNTTDEQMKYSPELQSPTGGRSYSPGTGMTAHIYTYDIGGRVLFEASAATGAATMTHARQYNAYSGCKWSRPGPPVSGSGRMQCWYSH
jgi:hypothetical protein